MTGDTQAGRDMLAVVGRRIGGHVRRREVRERMMAYLAGLLAMIERKNGWQLAEQLGEHGPRNVQRVLSGSQWDADAVRDDLRGYVVEQLGARESVLIIDETGFLKKGTKSAGVQRQYSGTAGRIENCQIGVFLAYGSSTGRALLDRELYLPKEWLAEPARCQEAGIPENTVFASKPQLALRMLDRADAAAVPAAWVVADEVYGNDESFRRHLERKGQASVLAVSSSHLVWQDMAQRSVGAITAELPPDAWTTCSAGAGSKGERLYDWACLRLPYQAAAGMEHRILVRRSRTDDAELAYFRVLCPTPTALENLAQVAGMRWMIEECFEDTKGSVGLDQYEVRRYDAWYRFMTLALLAHAVLEVTRLQLTAQEHALGEGAGTVPG
ncbi:MAG: IS701 family transposase [Actinomycetota bacterium]|nr:IS701 family transposase [Actinomycetota bacterium]